MTELKERLREARERAGLSARALDKLAGITPGHTTAIEEGNRARPSVEVVAKLAEALGVSIDWLVSGRVPADETGPLPAVFEPTLDRDGTEG